MAKCLLPDQRYVSVRWAGDLDLIQRHSGCKNPTEDLLYLRLLPARMKQCDLLVPRWFRNGTEAGVIKKASGLVSRSGRDALRDPR